MIDVVILAAGMSKRMKDSNKLLLEFNNLPLIEYVLKRILGAQINKVIVVLGHDHKSILTAIGNYDVEFIFNAAYKRGQTTSIQAAMSLLDAQSDAFMVCLGDMPLLESKDYNALIDTYYKVLKSKTKPIVRPVFKNSIGNPVIFHRSYASDILNLDAGQECKDLIRNEKDNYFPFKVNVLKYFFDIDNSDDYRRLLLSTRENEL